MPGSLVSNVPTATIQASTWPAPCTPQTLLALDHGEVALPPEYGYPLRVRVPTKLGFKNPKHIVEIFVSNDNPGGYWEDQGYNWFSGI